ncbi:hypothetical protein [Streptomyces sp. NPDC017988]|uniref:hypothetical protein n=1 Tax=Streptomyces sp. NPDC017988 TaxID=3365025 RepID=UPI00379BD8B7
MWGVPCGSHAGSQGTQGGFTTIGDHAFHLCAYAGGGQDAVDAHGGFALQMGVADELVKEVTLGCSGVLQSEARQSWCHVVSRHREAMMLCTDALC